MTIPFYLVKVFISAGIIVGISELAKQSTLMGSLLASLPLISVMAMIWMYIESKNTHSIVQFSSDIVWLVLASLILFISLPLLLKRGLSFYPALGLACLLTSLTYLFALDLIKKSSL